MSIDKKINKKLKFKIAFKKVVTKNTISNLYLIQIWVFLMSKYNVCKKF